jgi:hypothetical protein
MVSRDLKQRRSAASRRGAMNSLRQLAWLRGYPDGDSWRTLAGETVILDGARVSTSRRAARTAMREHRDALAEAVGDVERWWRIVDAILTWASAPSEVLDLFAYAPPRLAWAARRLAQQQPQLEAALRASGIAWALCPGELAQRMDWLAERPEVGDFELSIQLQLVTLSAHGGSEELIALLLTDAPEPSSARQVVEQLLARMRRRRIENRTGERATSPPPPRSSSKVSSWINKLVTCEPPVQHRAMQVLAVADIAAALAPWVEWENASAARLLKAAAFAERPFNRHRESVHFDRIEAGLVAIRDAAPQPFSIEDALTDVMSLADPAARPPFHPAVVRLLGALPPSLRPDSRARLMQHFARIGADADDDRPAWLWRALAEAMENGANERVLGPWCRQLATSHRSWIDHDLVHPLLRSGEVQRLIRVLVALAARGEVSDTDAESASSWIAAGLAEAAIPEVVESMRAKRRTLSVANARLARRLAEDTQTALATTCDPLLAALENTREQAELRILIEHAIENGAGWWIHAVLAANEGAALATLASILALTPRRRWPAFTLAAPARWIARYPDQLAPALRRLAAVDLDAENTAKHRLASDVPDPEQLREEITALRGRVALTPSVSKRLANLEARLASPRPLSPQRLLRLAEKLEQSSVAIGLARLTAVATEAAMLQIVSAFGLDRWPDGPLDRRMVRLLLGLLRLEPADRTLAGRLLRARTGPPPWDLRNDPVNLHFLARMHARGLAMEPWLDDAPITVAGEGAALQLALCSDPLEVFEMGAHFETCLSPGAVNYFSVIANAADINKRVLYARRGTRVIGRCLLAITDAGGLLAFNPYCHESLDFAVIVREYAVQLAGQMRTSVVPRGAVSVLLARDWYDDGPRDLVGRFDVLNDNLQLDLGAIAASALPARLRELTGHDLDDITLPLVLALPGLRQRPDLFCALAPYLLNCSTAATRVAAAEMAWHMGEESLADRLLGEHGTSVPVDWPDWGPAEMVAHLRPSLMLSRLRQTRYRAAHGWRGESGERLALAAIAMERLHRPRQAAEMYRLAIERAPYLSDQLRSRLHAGARPVQHQ